MYVPVYTFHTNYINSDISVVPYLRLYMQRRKNGSQFNNENTDIYVTNYDIFLVKLWVEHTCIQHRGCEIVFKPVSGIEGNLMRICNVKILAAC